MLSSGVSFGVCSFSVAHRNRIVESCDVVLVINH